MALTIEFEQKIADGTEGLALEYPGELLQAFAQDGSGNLQGSTTEVDEGDFTPTLVFDAVGICAQQTGVEYSSLHMYSTDGIYGSWLFGDKQQLVIYLLEYDITDKLDSGNLTIDTTQPVHRVTLEFVETPDLLIDDQRSLLDPGARIRLRFQAGDSDYLDLGTYYVDRSQGGDLKKIVRLEGRGLIGKPLQDQTFDENYNAYAYGNAKTTIEAILADAGYTAEQYRVETTAENIGFTFDRKKKIYDGLVEILEALDWQIREHPDGYLVIGASTYSEFIAPSDYEFDYGPDCYSRGFVIDDREAYTRVCVHTNDWTVAVYEDVEIYTSWQIGDQKTLYIEVPDGTSSGSATSMAADIASKMANTGTIETFRGPFRPYLIPGDTAKITKDLEERTVGIITNITHGLGKRGGFYTEFQVDSGGVQGIGRMKDYIQKLQKKPTGRSTRAYT